MSTFTAGMKVRVPFMISQADLLAPVVQDNTAFDDGSIDTLQVIVQTTITTGGTIKVQAGGVDVPGAVVTIPNGAVKGTVFTAAATRGSDAGMVTKGSRLSLVPAGFATAGAVNGHVTIGTQNRPAGV